MTREQALEITQQLQKDFKDVFIRIGCLDRTFSLQIKPDSKLANHTRYPWDVWLMLGKRMVQQLCISTETQWKVRLYLDQVRLNQAIIRLIHSGPTLNDIFPKLNNAKYLSHRCEFWISQTRARWEIIIPLHTNLADEIQEIAIWNSPKGNMFQRK